MDPIDFIDSRDVRAYLREIDYKPNSIEAAFLIWQSSKKTLDEKHVAWNWLIESMPDMAVPERNGIGGRDSLHEMLEGYMIIEDGLIEMLKDASSDHVYKAEARGIIDCGLARSFKGCYMGALKMIGNNVRDDMDGLNKGEFYVKKLPVVSDGLKFGPGIQAVFDFHGRLMDIDGSLYDTKGVPYAWLDGMDPSIKYHSFNLMWFDIPTPFKRGDIVRSMVDENVFVLEETPPQLYAKRDVEGGAKSKTEPLSNHADSTDMLAWGSRVKAWPHYQMRNYLMLGTGEDYLKIERVTDELVGEDRILYAYSALLKGKLQLPLFLRYINAVSQMHGHEHAKRVIDRIEEKLGLAK